MNVMLSNLVVLILIATGCVAQPDRYGMPACEAPHQLARRVAFSLCFNPETRVAVWSIYELLPEHLAAARMPRPGRFRRDAEVGSATDGDYHGSGYQRGHLVPASDVSWSAEALADSFLLSNAAPQRPAVNLSAVRRLENAIRRLAESDGAVYVVTGTLYDCGTEIEHIGRNNVAVPCAYYKVFRSVQGIRASVVSNETKPIAEDVSVSLLERRTGLQFFHE